MLPSASAQIFDFDQDPRSLIAQAAQTQSKSLDLSSLGLSEIPDEIGQLTQLEQLDLSDNRLANCPRRSPPSNSSKPSI